MYSIKDVFHKLIYNLSNTALSIFLYTKNSKKKGKYIFGYETYELTKIGKVIAALFKLDRGQFGRGNV